MKKRSPSSSINRRQFLASSGAAGALAACSGPPAAVEAPAVAEKRATPLDGPLPKANGLNLIVINADTTRADHLGLYGSTRCKTPNLDALARQAVVFDNSYADGLPTLPCRRVFFTGRSILQEKDAWWRALREDDVTLSTVLRKAGYRTGLVTDLYHYFKPGMNFQQGFDSFEFLRGQEQDAWVSGPLAAFDPTTHMPAHHVTDRYVKGMRQYMMNTADWKAEDDHFAAQVMRAAMRWLDRSAAQKPFFLWIDSFDPHEPWDAPAKYQKMYRDKFAWERPLFGYPIDTSLIQPDDYPYIGDLYSAEVTFTDHWIGSLLEKIESMKLLDDTIVVFSTDHGTHLGEFGCVQKTPGLCDSRLANLALMIRHPDAKNLAGKRVSSYVSAADYMPTLLALLGLDGLPGMDGKSFWPTVEDASVAHRDKVFFGYGDFGAVRTKDWHYFQNWRGEDRGKGPALFDVASDPKEEKNVVADHPDVVAELRGLIAERFQAELPTMTPQAT